MHECNRTINEEELPLLRSSSPPLASVGRAGGRAGGLQEVLRSCSGASASASALGARKSDMDMLGRMAGAAMGSSGGKLNISVCDPVKQVCGGILSLHGGSDIY
jgi:hypothetical protein